MSTARKAFETYRVQLQMRGQAVNTVYLNRITAPEFLLIQHVHGRGSAKMMESQGADIERRMNEQGKWLQRIRPSDSLMEYLINKYNKNVFEQVFPGVNPVLPYTYEDAGITRESENDTLDFGDGWEEVGVAEEAPKEAVKGKPMAAVAKTKDPLDLIGDKKA